LHKLMLTVIVLSYCRFTWQ